MSAFFWAFLIYTIQPYEKFTQWRSTAEVGEGKYTLVHDSFVNVQDIQDQLPQATKEIDPTSEGIEAEAASIASFICCPASSEKVSEV